MPVDIGLPSTAIRDFAYRYPEILSAVISDRNVGCLFNILWVDHAGKAIEAYKKAYKGMKDMLCQKPVVTWVYSSATAHVDKMRRRMQDLAVPLFPDPETSIRALGMALKFKNLAVRSS